MTITGKKIPGRGTAQHGVTPAVETVRRPVGLGRCAREKEARGARREGPWLSISSKGGGCGGGGTAKGGKPAV